MKVESIAECSLGAFCNTFDLHEPIIHLKKQFLVFFLSGRLRHVLLYLYCFRGALQNLEHIRDESSPLPPQIQAKEWMVSNSFNCFVCLVLFVPVNRYGYAGTVSSPFHSFFLGKLV